MMNKKVAAIIILLLFLTSAVAGIILSLFR